MALFRIGLVILAALLAFSTTPAAGQVAQTFEISSATIRVFEDGSVGVNLTISVADPPAQVLVEALGEPLYYELVSGGSFQPVVYAGGSFNGTVFGESAYLYYVTADPTTKNGSLWILELDLPWPARIALPRDALILSVDPQPGVSIEGDTVYLVYEPGRVRVSYVIVPVEVIATESPGQPPGETATETPATIPPPGDEEASPVDGLAAEMPSWVPLLLGGAVAVASLAFLLLRRGRSGAPEAVVGSSGLDERDQAIIEAVRRLGEATSSELMEATGIPKTPLYRRLGKLVDMGYLESFERAGKRYYRVKKR